MKGKSHCELCTRLSGYHIKNAPLPLAADSRDEHRPLRHAAARYPRGWRAADPAESQCRDRDRRERPRHVGHRAARVKRELVCRLPRAAGRQVRARARAPSQPQGRVSGAGPPPRPWHHTAVRRGQCSSRRCAAHSKRGRQLRLLVDIARGSQVEPAQVVQKGEPREIVLLPLVRVPFAEQIHSGQQTHRYK